VRILSDEELRAAEAAVAEAAKDSDSELVWRAIKPLVDAQSGQRGAALTLLRIVDTGSLSRENAFRVLVEIEEHHSDDIEIISNVGWCLEEATDTEFLNRAPSEHGLYGRVVDTLRLSAGDPQYGENESLILRGLATAARMMARQQDKTAEAACKRLVELNPESSSDFYRLGLFLKTRGHFRDGMLANLKASELSSEPSEAVKWNLGICATGAGEAEVALKVWRELGNKLDIGRFELPDGSYSSCKVRLAERPLAERDAASDDPGLEETVWIERLSPCHGIIRSVLYSELGVDFGDVVLIDGAPVTYHRYGDEQVPVFPHLATLMRRHYQFFDFAGIQVSDRQLQDVSRGLSEDAVVYSHTEQVKIVCASCWNDTTLDHEHKDTLTKNVVLGRIAAAPHAAAAKLLREVDAAVAARAGCELFAPSLARAAGLEARALADESRFELLRHSGPSQ
jgi:hypothetical protein